MVWSLYVDGSYNDKIERAAYAFAIIRYGIRFHEECGVLDDHMGIRNVAGEIYAVQRGLSHLFKKDHCDTVTIYYDYTGIEHWADGTWRTNTHLTSRYQKFIQQMTSVYNIKFQKVKAHSGDKWNEHVDRLAKSAFEDYRT